VFLSKEQNFYPDLSCVDTDGNRFAVDMKPIFIIDGSRVNRHDAWRFYWLLPGEKKHQEHHISI